MIFSSRPSPAAAGQAAGHSGASRREWLRLLYPIALAAAASMMLLVLFTDSTEQAGERLSILATLGKWTPLLAQGFLLNLIIVTLAMATGTLYGICLGLLASSHVALFQRIVWILVQFFRNTPTLVLLFLAAYMLPSSMHILGVEVSFPDWVKAVIGFSLKVMANVAEIVRGAIQSVPGAQWEAAESLAFRRSQIFWRIILPQCYKRMLPPWMNLYGVTFTATPLAAILGVNEVLGYTLMALGAESRFDLVVPMYLYVLCWFYLFAHPVTRLTQILERRFALIG
jgi:polar amino acid transport system permease protein